MIPELNKFVVYYFLKQPLHSRFIFEDINDGEIAMMTSLDFSNKSVKLVLSPSACPT